MVLAHYWIVACLVDSDLVVAECHSMVAVDCWATVDSDQREVVHHRWEHQQVVGAPFLQCALLLGAILD